MQGELTAAAAEIEHALACGVAHQLLEAPVLHRGPPLRPEALHVSVSGEELRIVVDVLGSVILFHGAPIVEPLVEPCRCGPSTTSKSMTHDQVFSPCLPSAQSNAAPWRRNRSRRRAGSVSPARIVIYGARRREELGLPAALTPLSSSIHDGGLRATKPSHASRPLSRSASKRRMRRKTQDRQGLLYGLPRPLGTSTIGQGRLGVPSSLAVWPTSLASSSSCLLDEHPAQQRAHVAQIVLLGPSSVHHQLLPQLP